MLSKRNSDATGNAERIVMRHRTPFLHVFGSDGYSAYYNYLWSDVLTADAYGAFLEGGGRTIGSRRASAQYIFSVSSTIVLRMPIAHFVAGMQVSTL